MLKKKIYNPATADNFKHGLITFIRAVIYQLYSAPCQGTQRWQQGRKTLLNIKMNTFINILSFGAILSSVLVITSKNPVVAVIFLISLFINTAGYLILLGIGFVGISYIIVYVGAITVLFLFVIMMINIRLLDILEIGSEYTKNLPLAFLVGTLFVYEIFSVIPFSLNNIAVLNLPLDILNLINDFFLSQASSSSPLLSYLPVV